MVGGYAHLLAAIAVFLITHSVPAIRPVRAAIVSAMGERTYVIVYSIVSVAAITWMILAALAAPYLELWPMTLTAMWLTAALMALSTVLLVFGLTTPNPLSLPVRVKEFNPDNPGLLAITRHPILLGLALWALAHVISNGSLSGVLLFGFACVFSLGGMMIIDRRRKRAWGEGHWQTQAAKTSLLSWRPSHVPLLDARWVVAALVYGLLIWLHPLALGVQPLPF